MFKGDRRSIDQKHVRCRSLEAIKTESFDFGTRLNGFVIASETVTNQADVAEKTTRKMITHIAHHSFNTQYQLSFNIL